MKLRANCKINIGLDVLRRRADGFHDVSTVMVPVRKLYDRLEIEPAIETELVQRGLPVDCPPEDNICLRAWRLMHERYGAGPVRIVLDKRVPYGVDFPMNVKAMLPGYFLAICSTASNIEPSKYSRCIGTSPM